MPDYSAYVATSLYAIESYDIYVLPHSPSVLLIPTDNLHREMSLFISFHFKGLGSLNVRWLHAQSSSVVVAIP